MACGSNETILSSKSASKHRDRGYHLYGVRVAWHKAGAPLSLAIAAH